MRDLLRDVVLAVRRLRSAPAFTLFAVLTLAAGIGTTTAAYAFVRTTILRPPHIREIDSVVNIYHAGYGAGPQMLMSWPDIRDLTSAQRSFDALMVWRRIQVGLSANHASEFVLAELVSGNYFAFVGASARLGRLLQPADDAASAAPVTVISEAYWHRRFQSDVGVIGQVVSLNGQLIEIVGVVALPFQGVDMPNVQPTPMWLPIASSRRIARELSANVFERRDERRWHVKARLRTGVTVAQAAAEVVAIGEQLDASVPLGTPDERARRLSADDHRFWRVVPTASIYVHESIDVLARPAAIALTVMITLVLLVTCTNVANLLLARGTARRAEFAMRYALGASRWRVVREQIVECALLAIVAGAAAFATARWAVVELTSLDPVRVGPGVNLQLTSADSGTIVMTAIAGAAVALLVFGVGPALHLTRGDLNRSLAANAFTGTVARWRGRRALIAAQVAVSAALVAIAVFTVQNVMRTASRDTGLDLEHFAAAAIDFSLVDYDEARARESLRLMTETVRQDARSELVALASGLPGIAIGVSPTSALFGRPEEVLDVRSNTRTGWMVSATSGLFDAIGIRLTGGRLLSDRDIASTESVVVVSEIVARSVFGTSDAVGRDLQIAYLARGEQSPTLITRIIVGVVSDTDVAGNGPQRRGTIYVPFEQHYDPQMAVVVRSRNAADIAAALPELVRRADPRLAIRDVGTGMSLSGVDSAPLRVMAGLTGVLGAVALIVAMSGLYGVLSYVVAGRRREIGVRRALGASSGDVVHMIVKNGLQPVVWGLVAGLAVAGVIRFGLGRILRSMPPVDMAIALVPALFILAGLFASYLPARRATRVEPSEVLREL